LRGDGQSELLELVRAGQRAARQSIRTFSCTVSIQAAFPDERIVCTGKYWRSPDSVRVEETSGNRTENYLVKNSKIFQVASERTPQGRQSGFAALRRPASERLCQCDVWTLMDLDLSGPGGRPCDLDQLLALAKDAPNIARETVDGDPCIRLRLSFDDPSGDQVNLSLWHDVHFNYLIRKEEWQFGRSGSYSIDGENQKFAEVEPGIYFPLRHVTKVTRRGQEIRRNIATLSDVRINSSIADQTFKLPPVAAGTTCRDKIEGKVYKIDSNGNQVGEASPLTITAAPSEPEAGSSPFHSQSTEEPKAWTRWLAPGFAVVLVCGIIGWLYRWHFASRGKEI